MPAEYTSCVESYRSKGVSTKSAKARCAAMYYKRHGITVREAAKKSGIAMELDYDEELTNAIINGLPIKVQAALLDREGADVWGKTAVSGKAFLEIMDGVFEVVMTVPGAKCNCSDGHQLTWTDKILSSMASTWTGGTLSANHNYELHGKVGDVLYAWYENNEARGLIKPTPEVYALMKEHPELVTGVSIEATQIKYDSDLNITNAIGTGLAVTFDPILPQCSPKDGCRVVALDIESGENMTDETKEPKGICPTVHATVVAERDTLKVNATKLEADVVAMKADIETMKAEMNKKDLQIKAFEDIERANVIASIKEFVDEKDYKELPLETLRVVASAVLSTKAKVADEPIVFASGATPEAVKTVFAELKAKGYSEEEIRDYAANFPIKEAK